MLGFVGTAGIGALLTSLSEITRPARLRRHAEALATVRDLLPEGSEARRKLERALEAKADKLADMTTGAPRSATLLPTTSDEYGEVALWRRVEAVLTVVAVTTLYVAASDDSPGLTSPWAQVFALSFGGVVAIAATDFNNRRARARQRRKEPGPDEEPGPWQLRE